jgi:hypothetical protein
LARWSAKCAAHVLELFEHERPEDRRPRQAIDTVEVWIRGEIPMMEARQLAFVANAAARGLPEPAKFAALSAGQAVAVAHVAAHNLGAAAYAIRAAQAASPPEQAEQARRAERDWQRDQLPAAIKALVKDDQRQRNSICWYAFDD